MEVSVRHYAQKVGEVRAFKSCYLPGFLSHDAQILPVRQKGLKYGIVRWIPL